MQKTAYTFNGEHGVVDQIVKLVKEGKDIDIHSSCRIGTGCYVIEYSDTKEKPKEKEVLVSEVLDVKSPEWDKAKAMSPDKDKLEKYAEEFNISLDKRKGFTSMLKSFQGKWNSTNK